ncbi:zf-HC2 domain-containing protein [Microbacterium sp. NPDC057659]|uniref:zf-HC2 domain-containing protein n=1 Tax=Microbacterium sp. NPDC057659 TaxID=3346198 RepID=UPI00366ED61C
MNVDHERYATWDAAYALGALSAAERAEYEEHLARCAACRAAAAELGPTVSLLSRLSADEAQAVVDPDAADAGPVRVLAAARARRSRRRRVAAWASGVAAAVVLGVVATVAVLLPRPAEAIALEPVAGAPVSAEVALTSVPWGTKLDLVCEYDGYGSAAGKYMLAVTGIDGTTTTLSTWNVKPGAAAKLSAGTALAASDIRSIEILDAGGAVMVRHSFE